MFVIYRYKLMELLKTLYVSSLLRFFNLRKY
jgi:hypothetical protein